MLRNSNRQYDLVAFDVDGTLVGNRRGKVVWQVLNRVFARQRDVCALRAQAYQAGAITYAEWVALDVGDWAVAGATRADIVAIIHRELYLIPGAQTLVSALKRQGYRLSVISGTLNVTLDALFPAHPFDDVHTNQLWFDEAGHIAGWQATPYDMAGKAVALKAVAQQFEIPLPRTVFVGDHLNDLHVMEVAGLAIAFEPKDPLVAQTADHVIRGNLMDVLPLLG